MTTAGVPPLKSQINELHRLNKQLEARQPGTVLHAGQSEIIDEKAEALVKGIAKLKQAEQKTLAKDLKLDPEDKALLESLAGKNYVADKELGAIARVLGTQRDDLAALVANKDKPMDGGATGTTGPMGFQAQLNGVTSHVDAVRGQRGPGSVHKLTDAEKITRDAHEGFQGIIGAFEGLADGSSIQEWSSMLRNEGKALAETGNREGQMQLLQMARDLEGKQFEIGTEASDLLKDGLLKEMVAYSFKHPKTGLPLPNELSVKQREYLDSLVPPNGDRLRGLLDSVGTDTDMGAFISAAAVGNKLQAGSVFLKMAGLEAAAVPPIDTDPEVGEHGLMVTTGVDDLINTERTSSPRFQEALELLHSRSGKIQLTKELNARKAMVARVEKQLENDELPDDERVGLERQLASIQPLIDNLEGLKSGNVGTDKAGADERYVEEVLAYTRALPTRLTPKQTAFLGRLANAAGGVDGLGHKLDNMGPEALADIAGAVRRGGSEDDLQQLGRMLNLKPVDLVEPAEPNEPATVDAAKNLAETLSPEFFDARSSFFQQVATAQANTQAELAATKPDLAATYGSIAEALMQNSQQIGMLAQEYDSVKAELAKAGDQAINAYATGGERGKLSDGAVAFLDRVKQQRAGEATMLGNMRAGLESLGVPADQLRAFDPGVADAYAAQQTNKADSSAKLGEFDSSSLQGRAQAMRKVAGELDDKANKLIESQAPGMEKTIQALRTSVNKLREHCASLDMLVKALPHVEDQLKRPGVVDAIQEMDKTGDRTKVTTLLNPNAMGWVDEYFKVKGAGAELVPQLRKQMTAAHVPKELTDLLAPQTLDEAAATAAKAVLKEDGPTPRGPVSEDQIIENLKVLQKTNPEAYKAITEFRSAQEKAELVAKSSYMEIMSLLDSGLPIEMIIMMVMLKLTERHEEKFKLKVKEMGVAEQLERINAPRREKLQAQLQRGEISQTVYDAKLAKEVAQPADYGIHAKSTTILMQELQVEMQYFMQVMNALGAVMKQTQDMVMTPIRNMR